MFLKNYARLRQTVYSSCPVEILAAQHSNYLWLYLLVVWPQWIQKAILVHVKTWINGWWWTDASVNTQKNTKLHSVNHHKSSQVLRDSFRICAQKWFCFVLLPPSMCWNLTLVEANFNRFTSKCGGAWGRGNEARDSIDEDVFYPVVSKIVGVCMSL